MNSAKEHVFTEEQPTTAVEEANNTQVKSPTITIETLPRDVMLLIFSYLGQQELRGKVLKVCQDWATLCEDPSLYRELKFDCQDSVQDILQVLGYASWFKSLTLTDLPNVNTILFEVLRHPNRLCSLTLKQNMVLTPRKISYQNTRNLFKIYKNIHTLIIDGSFKLEDIFYQHVGTSLNNLKILHLIGVEDVSNERILSFANSCPPNLEEFIYHVKVQYNRYSPEISAQIISAIIARISRTVRVLHLYGFNWTPEYLESLEQCRLLRELVVNMSTPGRLRVVGPWQSMRRLDLHLCYAPAAEWLSVCGCSMFKNLEVITANGHGFTDQVAGLLGTNFKKLRKLTLFLEKSKGFSSVGLMSILKGCTLLKELSLKQPTDELTYAPLLLLPIILPELQRLAFTPRTRLESAKLKLELKIAMPNLSID